MENVIEPDVRVAADEDAGPIYSIYALDEHGCVMDYDTSRVEARFTPTPGPSDMLGLFDRACDDARRDSKRHGMRIGVYLYEPGMGVLHAQAIYDNGVRD